MSDVHALASAAEPHVEDLLRAEIESADGVHLQAINPADVARYVGMVVAMLPDVLTAAQKAGVPIPANAIDAARVGVLFFSALFKSGFVPA